MAKIEIGFNQNGTFVSSDFDDYDKSIELFGEEKEAFEIIMKILQKAAVDISTYKAVQRSKDYVTLLIGENNDFCRIHFGERSKWVSVDMWGDAKIFKSDSRFSNVKNKNQRHWKIKLLNVEELNNLEDIIVKAAKI